MQSDKIWSNDGLYENDLIATRREYVYEGNWFAPCAVTTVLAVQTCSNNILSF